MTGYTWLQFLSRFSKYRIGSHFTLRTLHQLGSAFTTRWVRRGKKIICWDKVWVLKKWGFTTESSPKAVPDLALQQGVGGGLTSDLALSDLDGPGTDLTSPANCWKVRSFLQSFLLLSLDRERGLEIARSRRVLVPPSLSTLPRMASCPSEDQNNVLVMVVVSPLVVLVV